MKPGQRSEVYFLKSMGLHEAGRQVAKLIRRRRDTVRFVTLFLILAGILALHDMNFRQKTTKQPDTFEFADSSALTVHRKIAMLEEVGVQDVTRLVSKVDLTPSELHKAKQEFQKKEFMHRQSLLSADEKAMEGISDDQDSDFFDENMQDNSAQITSNEDTKEEDQEESDVTAPLKEVNPEVLPPKPMDSPFMKQILPNPNEDSDTDDSGALESDDKRKRLSLTEAGSFKEKVKEIKARIGLAKKRVIKSNHSKKTVPRAKENFESDSVDDKVKENVESDSVDDEVQTVDQSLYSSG